MASIPFSPGSNNPAAPSHKLASYDKNRDLRLSAEELANAARDGLAGEVIAFAAGAVAGPERRADLKLKLPGLIREAGCDALQQFMRVAPNSQDAMEIVAPVHNELLEAPGLACGSPPASKSAVAMSRLVVPEIRRGPSLPAGWLDGQRSQLESRLTQNLDQIQSASGAPQSKVGSK